MRFLVKWTKEGNMKYISHLDIMRLFQRALKRTDIKLKYSEGFSPHPKMSIAQPLSLGYTSRGEYIEFETREDFRAETVRKRLAGAMPPGVEVLECTELKEARKVSALIVAASYTIGFGKTGLDGTGSAVTAEGLQAAVTRFTDSESVIIEKLQKKSGKVTEVDIRPMVRSLEFESEEEDCFLIKTLVDTGSASNINPEYITAKLCEFMEVSRDNLEVHTRREEMYAESETGSAIPLYLLR